MYRNINKNIMMVSTLVLAVILSSCSGESTNNQVEEEHHEEGIEFTKAQYDQAAIEIGKPKKRNMGASLKVNGIIDVPPHGNITISLPYGGFLKYTSMLPGTQVKKGQLLAIVENPDFIEFQQDYLENLSQRDYLKAEYERQEELYKEQVAAGKNFQLAKSAFDANEIRIKTMGDRLKMIGFSLKKLNKGETSGAVRIYSPIAGSVREVHANIGKFVAPQDAIMELTDTKDLHVELSVYENDIPKIKKGQIIQFTVTNSPNKLREAEVFLIGSGVREDRSVTVHGHLHHEEKDILPGMYVSANVIIGSNEVWTVPEESVVRFGGKQHIFLDLGEEKENGQIMHRFEMKEVILGNKENGFVELKFEDESDDFNAVSLVTKGAYTVLSKSKNTESGHGH